MSNELNGRSSARINAWSIACCLVFLVACGWNADAAEQGLRLGTFDVDVTPPLGSPVAYAPTRSIDDPLSARGIVLLGAGQPIVLCAVDFIGIGNSGHDQWRRALASAASTTFDRVAIHTLHQHDAPRCDFAIEAILAEHGMAGERFDIVYLRDVIERTAAAVRSASQQARSVSHLGMGTGVVKQVASNRRILGDDGKVSIVRWSRTTDAAAIAAPEGLIDPQLRLVSFWQDDEPLAALTYYATHPQSYYGDGDVTCEFVGLARNQTQAARNDLLHVHFNGAGGNITAGKYNDGSPAMRPVLAKRLAAGMAAAWEATERYPLTADQVTWHRQTVQLPLAPDLNRDNLVRILEDETSDSRAKLMAADDLAWLTRCEQHDAVDLTCLRIGPVTLVHLPGELFVEYQLAAQEMLPDQFVCVAAYGDYGPGYIGTEESYAQGGYETQPSVSRVAPQVESILTDAMRQLLVGD